MAVLIPKHNIYHSRTANVMRSSLLVDLFVAQQYHGKTFEFSLNYPDRSGMIQINIWNIWGTLRLTPWMQHYSSPIVAITIKCPLAHLSQAWPLLCGPVKYVVFQLHHMLCTVWRITMYYGQKPTMTTYAYASVDVMKHKYIDELPIWHNA